MSYFRATDGDNLRVTRVFDDLLFHEIQATHEYHFQTFLPTLCRDWIKVATDVTEDEKEDVLSVCINQCRGFYKYGKWVIETVNGLIDYKKTLVGSSKSTNHMDTQMNNLISDYQIMKNVCNFLCADTIRLLTKGAVNVDMTVMRTLN